MVLQPGLDGVDGYILLLLLLLLLLLPPVPHPIHPSGPWTLQPFLGGAPPHQQLQLIGQTSPPGGEDPSDVNLVMSV